MTNRELFTDIMHYRGADRRLPAMLLEDGQVRQLRY